MHTHSGCCGCAAHAMKRRTFLSALGGAAAGAGLLSQTGARAAPASRVKPALTKKPIEVQPVLAYHLFERREATSWRPWGGLHTTDDIAAEKLRIQAELDGLAAKAEFPLSFRPLAEVTNAEAAAQVAAEKADVTLIYAATGGLRELETLIGPSGNTIVFVRHKSGPVYLWYEIAHPRLLRKTVDVYGQPGLEPQDVVVDDMDAVLWRLRSYYALKNTVGSRILAVGGASGWGAGGKDAPQRAIDVWNLDIQSVSYDDLGARIVSARNDGDRLRQAEEAARVYAGDPGIQLDTDIGFVSRAFLLNGVFEDLLGEMDAQALTVNECMSTIMPLSGTTACLCLTLLNDAGALAFCESDFVVIPSGILLHHIASVPVFLQDPTYPHDGMVTLAHCTAPRKMDGHHLEKAKLMTHFESDYGAAPKVEMRLGQEVTVIDPDFAESRWLGFTGHILDNPHMDICRSQIDVSIDGDWPRLVREMCGFHWMLAYGNHLRETGFALRKRGVDWLNITSGATIEA